MRFLEQQDALFYILRDKNKGKTLKKRRNTTNVVATMPSICDFLPRFFIVSLHRQSEIIDEGFHLKALQPEMRPAEFI